MFWLCFFWELRSCGGLCVLIVIFFVRSVSGFLVFMRWCFRSIFMFMVVIDGCCLRMCFLLVWCFCCLSVFLMCEWFVVDVIWVRCLVCSLVCCVRFLVFLVVMFVILFLLSVWLMCCVVMIVILIVLLLVCLCCVGLSLRCVMCSVIFLVRLFWVIGIFVCCLVLSLLFVCVVRLSEWVFIVCGMSIGWRSLVLSFCRLLFFGGREFWWYEYYVDIVVFVCWGFEWCSIGV